MVAEAGQDYVIGIDLGTTNSVVAVIEGDAPRIIVNAEGQPKTPSVVAFSPQGEVVVGDIAARQAATAPQSTISSVKRLIGRYYQEVADAGERYPYHVVEDTDGRAAIQVGDNLCLPEEISAHVLRKLKEAAEDYLDQSVSRAVVTVPAYFDDQQRQATLEAARLAGLEVLRLLNEPTAAAMAYGLGHEGQQLVAVYDFGGGTFDFSLMEIDDKTFEVLVSTGDSQLGGDDLDNVLVGYLADQFQKQHGLDLRTDPMSLRRLKEAAEKAKCDLSSAQETVINLPFIAYSAGQPVHLEIKITRDQLEDLIEELIQETLNCCQNGLRQAKLRKKDVQKVILVGGSTRIPLVQDMVEDFFGITPFKGLNPDEVVAAGAAIQAGVLNGALEEVVLLEVTPHTLGIEVKGNGKSNIVERNSSIPLRVQKAFTTTEDNQTFVNIHVLQGDSEKASECRSVGKFCLTGIEPCPAGVPRIQVTFFINSDGIVEISAEDCQSKTKKSLTINHAYLSVEERRSQHSAKRRRRSQRAARAHTPSDTGGLASGTGSSTGKRRGLEAETLPNRFTPPEATPPRPQLTDSQVQVRQELSATFAELDPYATQPGARGSGQVTASDATQAISYTPSPQDPLSMEPLDYSQGNHQQAVKAETMQWDKPATAPAAASTTPLKPVCTVPTCFEALLNCLLSEQPAEQQITQLAGQQQDFVNFCRQNSGDMALQLLLARYHIYTKQAEEARQVLVGLEVDNSASACHVLGLYNQLCHHFPNYVAARKERAKLAEERSDIKTAIEDLEFLIERESDNEELTDQLIDLYERWITRQSDYNIQFKLVKLYLRRQKVDLAIGQLQQLVLVGDYQQRANKVLGLCFWQKGMRYLAWQKFRALPMNDELKDMLYRLAEDMERNDELLHAKYCLERIYEIDINFREVDERLRKLCYRLEIQKEDGYAGLEPKAGLVQKPGGEFSRRFDIIGEINRGSMGIVYKARDLTLDEIVAIKVLNDFLCTDPQAIERFKMEARSARRLTHQHIVRIHDMFDLDGKKVISMEYIEGENLKTLLARNVTFNEDMVLTYLIQICEGLAYAHRLRLVHRDIKPANIMITDRNLVKITDFGIAKIINEKQTNAGTIVMGTPLYMAPEQIEGGSIDHRCDIYSLGIMLYEMVCGRPPFHEGNIEYQHLNLEAPPITAGVSDRLKKVIVRCIEKKPENRFQNVEEILARII